MCCFSVTRWRQKIAVSGTKIFARMAAPGVQVLAYSMTLSSKLDVAMVLPLPVRVGSGEQALTFINLEHHASLFADLEALFGDPLPPKGGMWRSRGGPKLEVHNVGAFIASYVPTPADFDRLDERFRLPKVLFDSVPAYHDYGFAVFQLTPGKAQHIHPMAFSFPTRDERLFFPTVHLHGRKFEPKAHFDHALYFQHASERGDQVSEQLPAKDYAGVVARDQKIARTVIEDIRANADIWIG